MVWLLVAGSTSACKEGNVRKKGDCQVPSREGPALGVCCSHAGAFPGPLRTPVGLGATGPWHLPWLCSSCCREGPGLLVKHSLGRRCNHPARTLAIISAFGKLIFKRFYFFSLFLIMCNQPTSALGIPSAERHLLSSSRLSFQLWAAGTPQ